MAHGANNALRGGSGASRGRSAMLAFRPDSAAATLQ